MMKFLKDWWNGARPGDPSPTAFPVGSELRDHNVAGNASTVTRRRVLLVACLVFLFLFLTGGFFGWDFVRTKEESWNKVRTTLEARAEEWKTKWANSEARAESWQKAATTRKRVKVTKRPVVLDLKDRVVVDYAWDWEVLETGTTNEGASNTVTIFAGAEASGNSSSAAATTVIDQGHKKDEKKSAWRFYAGPSVRMGANRASLSADPLDRIGLCAGGRVVWRIGGSVSVFKDEAQVSFTPYF